MSSTPTRTLFSPRRYKTFHALTNPSFRRIWVAGWLWYVNRMMEMAILSWLVLDLTDSPSQVTFVGISRMIPMFLLGLVAGSIADRFPKKRVMLTIQVVNLSVTTAMLFVILSGTVQPWHAFLSTFLLGLAWAVDFSARRSFFAELFEPDDLGNAVSLDIAALTGSSLIGPLIAGALIAFVGFAGAYSVMVVLFVIGFLLLLSMHDGEDSASRRVHDSVLSQIIMAVTMIRTNRTLWAALTVTVSLNFFGFPFLLMVPVIARDVLGANAVFFGILAAASGLGALTASLVIASRTIQRKEVVYSLGATLMLGSIAVFALSSFYPLSFFALVFVGFGMAGFATMQPTIALQAVPPEMRGRAMGAIALGIGASPMGMFVVGQAAEVIGPQKALALLAGTGVVVITLLRYMLPELRSRSA